MTFIKLVVELVLGSLHSVENVETPVNDAAIIGVLICTHVAHATVTAAAIFESFHVWKLVLIVQTTGRDVCCCSLCCLK